MRFAIFLVFLILFSIVLLYLVGDQRQATITVIEQEVELIAR